MVVVQFINVRILRGNQLVKDDLWIRDGFVVDPRKRFWEASSSFDYAPDIVIDGKNLIAAPGMIDIQLNGCIGIDFANSTPENMEEHLNKAAKYVLAHGVTSFCPTIVTSTPQTYQALLPYLGAKPSSIDGAAILGAHLEGPFINKSKYGAHNLALVQSEIGGEEGVKQMYGTDLKNVRIVTLAPELPGAEEAVKYLVKNGVVVSAGHSSATYAQGVASLDWGVTLVTHLFNAMTPFHHRDPGLIGLIAAPSPPFYSIIVDGIHSHPSSLRIAIGTQSEKAIVITDAGMAMGLGIGRFQLGTVDIRIQHDEHGCKKATLADSDVLAGSVVSMNESLKNINNYTNCGIVKALQAATLHPAQVLGLAPRKGTLEFGAEADLILVDDALHVHATFVGGALAWCAPEWKIHFE